MAFYFVHFESELPSDALYKLGCNASMLASLIKTLKRRRGMSSNDTY